MKKIIFRYALLSGGLPFSSRGLIRKLFLQYFPPLADPSRAVIIIFTLNIWTYIRLPDKSAYLKITFLFINKNISCGYSKEPSQWDGSFEHPKKMFKVMGKKIIRFLKHSINLLFCTYDICLSK